MLDPLEKEMATCSTTLVWKIPWKEEPDGLQSMGLERVGHNWATEHITHHINSASFGVRCDFSWLLGMWCVCVCVCVCDKWGFPGGSDVKNLPAVQETWVWSLGQEDPWRKEWQLTPVPCLENSMDRRSWEVIVHRVAKSWTQLSN